MHFRETALLGAYIIELDKRVDDRGFFARTWCQKEFAAHGLMTSFVQCNLSANAEAGTLRGLHYQKSPHQEAKLVQCVRGAIYDVIVDLRADSPTFRQWIAVELRPDLGRMLYVPEDFAHAYQTLEPDSEVSYMVSAFYEPSAGAGLRYDDPALSITWPRPVTRVSTQDRTWPLLTSPSSARRAPAAATSS
jgi:dTDP-4-dehydrorhamnose 3,5-epimerase